MDDRQLVKSVMRGDRGDFDLLVNRHMGLVINMVAPVVANAEDREEVIQDVFLKVHQKLETFRFDSKLSSWIGQIAYRMALNKMKKNQRILLNKDLDAIEFSLGSEDKEVEEKDASSFIQSLIRQLPATYQTVLSLYYLDELSYAEIVDTLGMPEGTVKNYLFRAKQKLKDLAGPVLEKEIGLL